MNMLTQRPSTVFNLLNGIDFPYCDSVRERETHPNVDIREEGDHFVLEADLPGVSEEEIDIHVDNSRLTIKVNREKEEKEGTGRYLLRERRAVNVSRSFALSDSVDTDGVEASFKNGILQIIAHKKERERTKSIKVNAANEA